MKPIRHIPMRVLSRELNSRKKKKKKVWWRSPRLNYQHFSKRADEMLKVWKIQEGWSKSEMKCVQLDTFFPFWSLFIECAIFSEFYFSCLSEMGMFYIYHWSSCGVILTSCAREIWVQCNTLNRRSTWRTYRREMYLTVGQDLNIV